MRKPTWLVMYLSVVMGMGCVARREGVTAGDAQGDIAGLGQTESREDLHVTARAPEGWTTEPIKTTATTIHQIWISPTGRTAFGVIYARLPLPVGAELALWGFMREMKKSQGEAELLDKNRDEHLDGLRFSARGRFYSIEAVLYAHGWDCWVSYAGRYSDKEADEGELALARLARERVMMGSP
jgi:hypothetical protein